MSRHNTSVRRVLIIGGGFAGLECARKLSNDDRFEVTLLDRTNHHLFQPLLYQVATASLAAPDIARSIRQILFDAKNVTVLMDEVTAISPAEKPSRENPVKFSISIIWFSPRARRQVSSETITGKRTPSA